MRQPSIKSLRNKADRLLQEKVRKLYKKCEVCGKPISCGHHFWPKSMSSNLRYDLDDIIPVCVGCHFRHHNGDPSIHEIIIRKRGQEWYDGLLKKKYVLVKTDRKYYQKIIESLWETA